MGRVITMLRIGRRHGLLAGVVALIVLAGCSSSTSGHSADGSTSTTGPAETSACVSAASSYLAAKGGVPTTLGAAYTPLPTKPTPGGTIIDIINGEIPTNNISGLAVEAAAKSAGWTGKILDFNGSVQDLNAKWEEAIAERPTAVISDGYPAAALATPLADARKAGVIAVLGSVADSPTSYPGFAGVSNGAAIYKALGELQAYLFMKASNCDGHVAVFNLAGFPVLEVDTDEFRQVVAQKCPLCKVTYGAIQPSDIGTPADTNQVVSALQADSSIKYVYTTVADTVDGVLPALSAAGITGIHIFGNTPNSTAIGALQKGTNSWWLSQSPQINGWGEAYLAMRINETHTPYELPTAPIAVITPQTVSHTSTDVPTYPTNYEQLFVQLWHGTTS